MGQNWAITIGINGYHYIPKLQYAQQDAIALRDYFQQDLKFQRVYYFSDTSPPISQDYGPDLDSKPTFATLRRFLRTRFEQAFLNPGDNLWFFFAGHGTRHEDRDYLMPIDADSGDIPNTAIPLNYVTERLRRCGADNVILMIDACRNRGGRDIRGIGEERQQGVITLFSCSPNEVSYEIAELQQGAFTHALLQALRLQGEGNCATVERLYNRLRYEVPQLMQRYQRPKQTPYGIVEPPSKYHLILLPRQATEADIATLKTDALTAEVKREYRLAKQLWIRVLAVSPASHEAIEAIERLALISATPTPPPTPLPAPHAAGGSRQIETPAPSQNPTFEFEIATIRLEKAGLMGLGTPKISLQRRKARAEYRVEELGGGITLDMVLIPAGVFMMGSPTAEEGRFDNENPQHQVKVPSFWMGKYPVTQAQWKAIASLPKIDRDLDPNPSRFKGSDRPVEQVSWHDAVEVCDRLSRHTGRTYRLPSEAEWEYACRAGTTTPFHFGETITTELANYRGTDLIYEGKTYPGNYGSGPKGVYREETTPVGSFGVANAFGLYDMHGNVWEWCLDHWHGSYVDAPTDGSAWINNGDERYRLLRGGSWYDGLPWICRSALRHWYVPDYRYVYLGFRVVCSSSRTP
jgi:formylglycine-generating enzyme required for sulfatase activity